MTSSFLLPTFSQTPCCIAVLSFRFLASLGRCQDYKGYLCVTVDFLFCLYRAWRPHHLNVSQHLTGIQGDLVYFPPCQCKSKKHKYTALHNIQFHQLNFFGLLSAVKWCPSLQLRKMENFSCLVSLVEFMLSRYVTYLYSCAIQFTLQLFK